MNDLYKSIAGSIIRTLLVSWSMWLVSKHLLMDAPDETAINHITDLAINALPLIAAQLWSFAQKAYQLKLTQTALAATPGTDLESVKDKVVGGTGVKLRDVASVMILALILFGTACKTGTGLSTSKPGGLNAADVVMILSDARFGVTEACSVEWLPPNVCSITLDAIDTATSAVNRDPANAVKAAYKVLSDADNLLPADNKAKPYLDGAVGILKPFIGN